MKLVTFGLLVAIFCLPAAASAGGADDRRPTIVKLDFDPRDQGDFFEGNVISPEPFCEKRRTVVVKYLDGDERVGRDKTNRHGFFEVEVDGAAASGTYKAVAKRKENEDKGFVCQRAVDTYEERHEG